MKNAEPGRISFHPSLVIAIILFFWISAGAAQAQNPPGQNIKRDLDVLDFIRRTISENYYDKNYRGIDLDAQFKSYAEKLKKSRSDQESLTLIAAAVMEFDDSHTVFLPPSFNQVVHYDWRVKMVGDTCVVTIVKPQSDAEKQGLKAGDVVLSIDGVQPSRANLWKLEYFFRYLNPHVDSNSGSGAEIIARLIQLEKRGKAIGDRTAGGVMLSDTFWNNYSLSFLTGSLFHYGVQVSVADLLMSDGKSLERVGVSPDELLLPKPDDIANKRDPVLARAAAILGANLDPEKAGALMESLISTQSSQQNSF